MMVAFICSIIQRIFTRGCDHFHLLTFDIFYSKNTKFWLSSLVANYLQEIVKPYFLITSYDKLSTKFTLKNFAFYLEIILVMTLNSLHVVLEYLHLSILHKGN